jgi:FecR protein/Putative zinc-finger
MSATSCPRLFEAEAMRDGRLAGAERTSFERHLTACPACSREVDSLETLAEALRARSLNKADELHVRRERTRLLASFDRFLVAPERRVAPRRLLWPAAIAALALGALVLWRVRPGSQAGQAPNAVVRADGAAVWSEHMEGNVERVVLERGALWIHVVHSSRKGGLVVVLPDGELEDTGTTFRVGASDGHTTRVAVQEGSVVLRIHGQPSVAIGGGDTWIRDEQPAVLTFTSSAPSPAEPTRNGPPSPSARSTESPRSPAPLASALAPDPSVDFRAAMAALDVGDNRHAAVAFASFVVEHPRDPRAEDAAYLRVVALQRSGDKASMKEAALEYLGRYPAGFRRAEVENLVR